MIYTAMLRKMLSNWIRKTGLHWHFANKVSRMEAIQCAIDALAAQRYLEIGVSSGVCFSAVVVPEKIGVDPVPAAPLVDSEIRKPGAKYFPMTSDDFFAQVAPQALSNG